jgi:opacity protein-like surface antigen
VISRRFGTVLVALVLQVMAPRGAHAQGFLSPLIGYDFGGDSNCPTLRGCEEKHRNIGIAFGTLRAVTGSEIEIAWASNFFNDPAASSSVRTMMANGLFAPAFGPVRPYGLMGFGLVRAKIEFPQTKEESDRFLGWDIGGGLMVFPSRAIGVRGEIRYFHALQDLELPGISLADKKLDFGRASAGVVFRF